jgi:hypothetical protein
VEPGPVPVSTGGSKGRHHHEKSIFTTTVAALTIGAAFALGAFAATPAKLMTERGVIEKVDPARKEFALKGGYLQRMATFEWKASTRFVENGKPAAASELKPGERADVNYARHGKQCVATMIAFSPSGKTAKAHKAHVHLLQGSALSLP